MSSSKQPSQNPSRPDDTAQAGRPLRPSPPPSLARRLAGVWFRHYRVYTRNLISNGLPPFLEPLIFLVGIGLGLGHYIDQMAGIPYLPYLASGLLVTSSMYTAAFECTFGTFIRLEYDKVYDGMLSAPMTYRNLLFGEILWAGTKGFFFTLAVLIVVMAFGIITSPWALLTPLAGGATGLMFGALGIFVSAFVKNINHFNFFFTGFLSPMFFFSGVVFPVENLPAAIRPVSEVFPLTHTVRIIRTILFGTAPELLVWDILYSAVFFVLFSAAGIRLLRGRLVD